MAKLAEGILFSGTIENLNFYIRKGRTIVRRKSSLTRKRVLNDKAFASTRQYAGSMALAARIGSAIYKALPVDIKVKWTYRAITGEAASLLYLGKGEQEVKDVLWAKYICNTGCGSKEATKAKAVNIGPASKETIKKLRSVFCECWERQGKPLDTFKQSWKRTSTNPSIFLPELEKRLYGHVMYMV